MSASEYRPDCGYAWMVVAACFAINFIMAGLVRAAGVLYIALIDVYGVSRKVATMPFSIRFCVRNMSGPLVGALGQRFGIRPVVLLGGLMCGLGGIVSALAPNVAWITFAWGGIHGLGYGMCNIIHVIIINRYFDKYKGIALGISYTGDGFGTFILPLLLDFLLEMYGLKGTFLILAGVSLHVVPAAMLLKNPSWEEGNSKSTSDNNLNHLNEKHRISKHGINNEGFDTIEDYGAKVEIKLCENSLPVITFSEQKNNQNHDGKPPTPSAMTNQYGLNSSVQPSMQFINFHSNKNYKNHRLSDTFMFSDIYSLRESSSLRVTDKNLKKKRWSCHVTAHDADRKNSQISVSSVTSCPSHIGKSVTDALYRKHFLQSTTENRHMPVQNANCCDDRSRTNSFLNETNCEKNTHNTNDGMSHTQLSIKSIPLNEKEVLSTLENAIEDVDVRIRRSESNDQEMQPQNPVLQFLKTNIKPMFIIISVTMALYVLLFISVFTIIIDYAADNDIPNEYGKFLIIAFSVTDVLGRLGFGVVLDKKWLSISYFAGLTTGVMGLCILVIPLFKSFAFWMFSFSLCGFVQGGTAIMFPVLVEHYMEKNEESVALGCLNFYGGLLMLPVPSMIGFFRDHMGSYDGVFWIVGALCIFAGSLWIFEPLIFRKKEEKICKSIYLPGDERN